MLDFFKRNVYIKYLDGKVYKERIKFLGIIHKKL